MINGFEEETKPLTEQELEALPLMIQGLKAHVNDPVTSNKMIEGLKARGFNFDGPRIRKLINHICVNNLVRNVVATSKGYYLATDRIVINQYAESLEQRSRAILAKKNCLDFDTKTSDKQKLRELWLKLNHEDKLEFLQWDQVKGVSQTNLFE